MLVYYLISVSTIQISRPLRLSSELHKHFTKTKTGKEGFNIYIACKPKSNNHLNNQINCQSNIIFDILTALPTKYILVNRQHHLIQGIN